ncbi:MAG: hypothetical protein A2Z27_00075 [candidate division Zixibacteria bacterium RBG_16_50_21]|nr:MAG: hypothetical protein A2Z27_00075 [candidate division Zixibacteria bacterium RBG_16_50_21]
MGRGRAIKDRLSILKELWYFIRFRKRWWLAPILVFLLLLSLFIVLTESSAILPFIYTLF